MRTITVKDTIELQKYKDPTEQHIFLVSKYFDISMEDVKDLPWPVFQKMVGEVTDYIDGGLESNSDYSQYINKQEKTNMNRQEETKITRSDLMDID